MTAPLAVRYRWALDQQGRPVSIHMAHPSSTAGEYTCPLCRGQMIPRLGKQLQHHFAHDRLSPECNAETVNHALLRRWIAIVLREMMAANKPLSLRWKCSVCGEHHATNLLNDVTHIEEEQSLEGVELDVVLYKNAPKGEFTYAAIVITPALTDEQLALFTRKRIIPFIVPPEATPADPNPAALLQFVAYDLLCPRLGSISNLVRDPEAIRKVLLDAVSRYPGYAYAAIESINGLHDMAKLNNVTLWLPRLTWQHLIGGTVNRLTQDVAVISQAWVHADGGNISLHYVTARDTAAIGIRRYSPGVTPSLTLDATIYQRKTTAFDIIRLLVTR